MKWFANPLSAFILIQKYRFYSDKLWHLRRAARATIVAILMMILSVALPFAIQPQQSTSYATLEPEPVVSVSQVKQPVFNSGIEETPAPPAPPAPAKSSTKPTLKPVTGTKNEQLQATIDNWIATHGGVVTVSVKGITDPSISASNKGDKRMYTASIYKMFETILVYDRINKGAWTNNQGGLNIDSCIEKMIVVSDNTCAVSIGGLLGWSAVDPELHGLGYGGSSLNGSHPYSTANDVARLMVNLETNSALNSAQRNAVLGHMKRQIYRSGIPAGNKGFEVANKVGFFGTTNTDGGIVYGPNGTYAVAILTTGTNFANIADLSAQIAKIMNQ